MKSDKELLAEILPEMEARVNGLTELWPGREVVTHLHRNERIVSDIKNALEGFPAKAHNTDAAYLDL